MVTKIFNLLIGCLFIYFTIVQFNDSDALTWIVIYGIVAITAFINIKLNAVKWNLFLLTTLTLLFIYHIPILLDWINAGQPAFIDYEPTDIVEAEKMREFFGLLISVLSMLIIYFLNKKSITNT